jgi:prepilin-type N-terminal cleavage/methylation domain-containing protein
MAKNEPGRHVETDNGGFTLIEVLVALTILAVALAPLLQVYSSGIRLGVTGEHFAKATIVAEAVIAEAAAASPYSESNRSGATAGGFDWQLNVSPFEPDDTVPQAFSFQTVVSWQEGRHSRSLTLRTLRLDPSQVEGQ